MIVNFKTTKWALFRLAFGISILINIYSITALNAIDECNPTTVIEQIDRAAEQLKDL